MRFPLASIDRPRDRQARQSLRFDIRSADFVPRRERKTPPQKAAGQQDGGCASYSHWLVASVTPTPDVSGIDAARALILATVGVAWRGSLNRRRWSPPILKISLPLIVVIIAAALIVVATEWIRIWRYAVISTRFASDQPIFSPNEAILGIDYLATL